MMITTEKGCGGNNNSILESCFVHFQFPFPSNIELLLQKDFPANNKVLNF